MCLLLISESLTSVPLPVSMPPTFEYAGIAPPPTGLVSGVGIPHALRTTNGSFSSESNVYSSIFLDELENAFAIPSVGSPCITIVGTNLNWFSGTAETLFLIATSPKKMCPAG